MGSSYAYPVLETTDPAEALAAVGRLMDLAVSRTPAPLIAGEVLVRTAESARRIAVVLPLGSVFRSGEDERPFWTAPHALAQDLESLEALLPATAELPEDAPAGTFEAALVAAAGPAPGWIHWELAGWPAMPGREAEGQYCGVQLCLNSRDLRPDRPVTGHMLYVCTRQDDQERAEWLASRAGLRLVGPASPSV
ncbi:hypothetical protein [Streptomyces sp. NPDC090112]|uniref:hypothetical protein n=1 Tax=Streptomyces sp. NPDC090112 TaxID=3365949 RepID=UPI003818B2B2